METREYYEPLLIEKIKNIPAKFLPDLINIIDVIQNLSSHLSVDKYSDITSKDKILSLAGSWSDFNECDEFIEEIYQRRKNFFSGKLSC